MNKVRKAGSQRLCDVRVRMEPCDVKVAAEAIAAKWIEFEVHRSEQGGSTMCEFALGRPSASIESVDAMLVIRGHED
jgi:hypothetical protein